MGVKAFVSTILTGVYVCYTSICDLPEMIIQGGHMQDPIEDKIKVCAESLTPAQVKRFAKAVPEFEQLFSRVA